MIVLASRRRMNIRMRLQQIGGCRHGQSTQVRIRIALILLDHATIVETFQILDPFDTLKRFTVADMLDTMIEIQVSLRILIDVLFLILFVFDFDIYV